MPSLLHGENAGGPLQRPACKLCAEKDRRKMTSYNIVLQKMRKSAHECGLLQPRSWALLLMERHFCTPLPKWIPYEKITVLRAKVFAQPCGCYFVRFLLKPVCSLHVLRRLIHHAFVFLHQLGKRLAVALAILAKVFLGKL